MNLTKEQTEKQVLDMLSYGRLDEYRLSDIQFTPDVIYDIGANVGGVSLYCSSIFPSAKIIAVEPEPFNYERLLQTIDGRRNIIPVNAAVGTGDIYVSSSSGIGNWMFLNRSSGMFDPSMKKSSVKAVTLDQLYGQYGGSEYIVKMDCESAEMDIIKHEPSLDVLTKAAYIAAELHLLGSDANQLESALSVTQWCRKLAIYHRINLAWHGGTIIMHSIQHPNTLRG